MISSDLARLIDVVHREKNIPRDSVIEVLESAMEAAARKRFGLERDIEAQYNEELGEEFDRQPARAGTGEPSARF